MPKSKHTHSADTGDPAHQTAVVGLTTEQILTEMEFWAFAMETVKKRGGCVAHFRNEYRKKLSRRARD